MYFYMKMATIVAGGNLLRAVYEAAEAASLVYLQMQ